WRMRAMGGPARKLMRDVKAVQWLPLARAIETLTHAHERAFLANVGPIALEAAARSAHDAAMDGSEASRQAEAADRATDASLVDTFRAWLRRLTQGAA